MNYLLRWLYEGKIRFNQVASWDDVYELFLFKQKYIQNGVPVDFNAASRAIYGQSWSLLSDSDALWRIYSPDKLSVRIKTTFSDLYTLLAQSDALLQGGIIYLGIVDYLTKKDIDNRITSYLPNIFDKQNIIDSLFIKRNSFSHEKEVRIILWNETVMEDNGHNIPRNIPPYVNISIQPKDLIKEITFDYRLDDNLFNCLKSTMQVLLPGVKIQKSTLGTFQSKTYII